MCGETPREAASSMRDTTASEMRAEAVPGSRAPSCVLMPVSSEGTKRRWMARMGARTTVSPTGAGLRLTRSSRLGSASRHVTCEGSEAGQSRAAAAVSRS